MNEPSESTPATGDGPLSSAAGLSALATFALWIALGRSTAFTFCASLVMTFGAVCLGARVARALRRWSSGRVGDDHIWQVQPWGYRRLRYSEITAARVSNDHVIVSKASVEIPIWPDAHPNPAAALELLWQRIPAHAWAATRRQLDDLTLGVVRRLSARPRGADAVAAYRETARTAASTGRIRIAAIYPVPPVRASLNRRDWSLELPPALVIAVACVVAVARDREPILALVGLLLGFVLCGFHLYVGIARTRRRHRIQESRTKRNEAFLGEEVDVTDWSWTSIDGRHRRRHHAADRLCPREGSHFHYEVVDAQRDVTLASYLGTTGATWNGALGPCSHELARLDRPIDSGRHFDGFPPALRQWSSRDALPRGEAHALVLELHADAVILHRLAPDGRSVGDTHHRDRDGALRQVADEYEVSNLVWSPIEREDGTPWWTAAAPRSRAR